MASPRNTLAIALRLEGGPEAKKEFETVGKSGEETVKRLNTAFAKAGFDKAIKARVGVIRAEFLKLNAVFSNLGTALAPLRNGLAVLRGVVGSLASGFGFASAGAGSLAAAIGLLAKSAAQSAADIKDQAEAFDLSTESLQNLQAIASQAGLNQEKLSRFFAGFINKIDSAGDSAEEAGKKVDDANKSFQKIKVPSLDGAGEKFVTVRRGVQEVAREISKTDDIMSVFGDSTLSTEEKLKQFAKRLFEIKDPVQRVQTLLKNGLVKRGDLEDTLDFLGRLANASTNAGLAIETSLVKGLSDAEIAAGDKTNDAFNRLITNLERTRNRLGLSFNVTPGIEGLNAFLVSFNTSLIDLTQNKLPALGQALSNAFQSIGQTVQTPFVLFTSPEFIEAQRQGALNALNEIKAIFSASVLGQIAQPLVPAFQTVWARIKTDAQSALQTIKSIISQIISSVSAAISRVSRLRSAGSTGSGSSGAGAGGGGGSGFARGGPIRGLGTATSDSIPVWASAGEFMVRTRAAMKVGYGFLNAVNSGRYDLAGIFDLLQARGYALGGAIGGLEPALAGGLSVSLPRLVFGAIDERSSPVSGLQPVTINFEGAKVDGLLAPPDVVGELMRTSVQKRVRSSGRKPAWYGGGR